MRSSNCKTCGQPITLRATRKGPRWHHANGQTFCTAKAQQGGYQPDYIKAGYYDKGEYRAMSPDYAAEVRGQNELSPD